MPSGDYSTGAPRVTTVVRLHDDSTTNDNEEATTYVSFAKYQALKG